MRMNDVALEVFGLARLILDYGKRTGYEVLLFDDIREYLFSLGMEVPESRLMDTFNEMKDAGWVMDIDHPNGVLYLNPDLLRRVA